MTSDSKKDKNCTLTNDDVKDVDISRVVPSFESTLDTSFFYTSDKVINSFDDFSILEYIELHFPDINLHNKDSIIKKSILAMLDDLKFVNRLLDRYNITILDLFKILNKCYGALFNLLFISKVKAVLDGKCYRMKPYA